VRSFCTALKPPASPSATRLPGGHAASGRSRPPPPRMTKGSTTQITIKPAPPSAPAVFCPRHLSFGRVEPLQLENLSHQPKAIRVPVINLALDILDDTIAESNCPEATANGGRESHQPLRPFHRINTSPTPEGANRRPPHLRSCRQVRNQDAVLIENSGAPIPVAVQPWVGRRLGFQASYRHRGIMPDTTDSPAPVRWIRRNVHRHPLPKARANLVRVKGCLRYRKRLRPLTRARTPRGLRRPGRAGLPCGSVPNQRSISTATKYRNATAAICYPPGLKGALPCSATNMVAAAGSSGRKGPTLRSECRKGSSGVTSGHSRGHRSGLRFICCCSPWMWERMGSRLV
jgi:hypothetical protein